MDSIAVIKLYHDARQTLDAYLGRELSDRILGDMLRKYQMLLNDAEMMEIVEIGGVEVSPFSNREAEPELDGLLTRRLNQLAKHPKAENQLTRACMESDKRRRSGMRPELIGWRLK